jgi:hypothetical protein
VTTRPLTLAVTGPTGEIGTTFIRARQEAVGEIRGMARRPFERSSFGWQRAHYVQGDILDRKAHLLGGHLTTPRRRPSSRAR